VTSALGRTTTLDLARAQIVRLGQALYDRGITPGRTGNLSVRVGDRVLMTPTNVSLGRLVPECLSLLDADGQLIEGDPPSKEYALHRACYARDTAASAVAHVHSTYAVAASCMKPGDDGSPIPPLTAYFVMRVGSLIVLPYFPPGDPALATALRDATQGRCALLANHGSIAAAADLEAAVDAVEEIEETAKLALLLRGVEVNPLDEAQIAYLRARY